VSKTYKYLSIYLGRYLYNKFLAPLPGIVLNFVFKVFPFILVISVFDNLKIKNKKKIKKEGFFPLIFVFIFVFLLLCLCSCKNKIKNNKKKNKKRIQS
jgi:hypothetical protein